MTKQQSSLDAFFGTKPNPKPKVAGPKQTKIAAFFTSTSQTKVTSTPSHTKPSSGDDVASNVVTVNKNDSSKSPVNVAITSCTPVSPAEVSSASTSSKVTTSTPMETHQDDIGAHHNSDDDDTPIPLPTKRRSKKQPLVINHSVVDDDDDANDAPVVSRPRNRKRRVIDDDDDEEDDVGVKDSEMIENDDNHQNTSKSTIQEKPLLPTTAPTTNSENTVQQKKNTATETATTDEVVRTTNKAKKSIDAVMMDKEENNDFAPAVPDDTKAIKTLTTTTNETTTTTTKAPSHDKKNTAPTTTTSSITSTSNSNKTKIETDTSNTKKKKLNLDTGKGLYKSNDEVLQELDQHLHNGSDGAATTSTTTTTTPVVWKDHTPVPYSIVCHTLSQIEQISGRLAIQEIMTTLLRQIILKHSVASPTSINNNVDGTSTANHDDAIHDSNHMALLKKDLQAIVYIASNTVAPAYECIELGIGDALLMKAIGQATGTNTNMIKQKYETMGDLGTVAQTYKGKQSTLGGFFTKSAPKNNNTTTTTSNTKQYLTAQEVWTSFQQIAQTKGNHSQQWKVDIIKRMLVRTTDPIETKYIIRGLQGKLRIGLAQPTVLLSIAHALTLSSPLSSSMMTTVPIGIQEDAEDDIPKEAKQFVDQSQPMEKILEAATVIVKKAYSEVPSFDAIIDAGLRVPLQYFYQVCTLTPGIPVTPMLAKPTKSVQEVLKRLNGLNFTCEYKYDGERAQIHMLSNGTTKVFSRNLLDTSEKYPEVPIFVKEACNYSPATNDKMDTDDASSNTSGVTSCVLDAEVVAWNSKTEQFVPFQILSTRKKTEESAETAKVQVIVQAFDLMYLNGQSLLHRTLSERRALLHQHFHPVSGKFQFAHYLDHVENGDTIVLEEFLENAIKAQCEGLMVKTLDVNAIYEPSRRSLNWLKLKKDYLEGLGDSVDLVPLGAYHGRGKRTGVYGAYLLACYDPDTEDFQSVCKIGTGFSDEMLRTLTDSLNQHIIPTKSTQYKVSDQLECDVWFDAVQVWEVKAADLSKSSTHRGAEGKTGEVGRGIGLRFPRFERIRDDKRPDMATTSDQILEMYYQQDSIVEGDNADDDDDGI